VPVITLASLRAKVLRLGDYAGSEVMSDAFVDESINQGLAELVDLVGDVFQDHFLTTATVNTVAGTQTVNLPASFYDLRALDREVSTEQHVPMRRIQLLQATRYGGRGVPRAYMLHGGTAPGTIRLFPIPDAVYTLRVTFDPLFTELSADADTFDFRNGWEEYVIHAALLRLDLKDEKPVSERMAMIERAKARIVGSAAKRNSAEPEYLTLPGEGMDEEYL
jgi:hypothetical protein